MDLSHLPPVSAMPRAVAFWSILGQSIWIDVDATGTVYVNGDAVQTAARVRATWADWMRSDATLTSPRLPDL